MSFTIAPISFANPVLDKNNRFSPYWQKVISSAIAAAEVVPPVTILGVAEGGTGADNTTQIWLPTAANLVNISSWNAIQGQYFRLGICVVVSGLFQADPTAAGTASFNMTLPIASAFTAANEAGGVAFCGAVAGQGAQVSSDVSGKLHFEWTAVDTAVRDWNFVAMYRVI